MAVAQTMTGDFHTDLKGLLPRLRAYALSLTRDRDRADDLVQETVVKALSGQHSYRPGTNFGAWLFRIQRNEFISGLRRDRPTVCLDDVISNALSHPPHQESGLIMREFLGAFHRLADGHGSAVACRARGLSLCSRSPALRRSVSTIKSRISRARMSLETFLTGEECARRAIAAPASPVALARVALLREVSMQWDSGPSMARNDKSGSRRAAGEGAAVRSLAAQANLTNSTILLRKSA